MANFNGNVPEAINLSEYLMKYNDLNVNLIDDEGKSPLHVAVKKE